MDSRIATYEHIQTVQGLIARVVIDLQHRAKVHDESKLVSPEVEVFDAVTERLHGLTYGSDEYKSCLGEMKPALDHHYANNSHHPEYGFANEAWRPVVGYEGLYEVSSKGRVKRLARVAERKGTQGDLSVAERMLSLPVTPKGYLRVQLANGDSHKNYMVHRLVATAFLDNPEAKPEVNHIDGDKANNAVANLEWTTSSENQLHAYETGLKEPNAKYFVHCVELDVVTCGCLKMQAALRDRGVAEATASGVYAAMDRKSQYLGFTFIGYPIAEGNPQSMVRGMSLFDLIEMICDWKAATMRHADGDIRKSLEINQKRFGYSDELKAILLNTLPLIES